MNEPSEVEPLDTSELAEDVLQGISTGLYRVVGPGQKPGKPVVVDAKGKFVRGSGRPVAANDIGYISKTTSYKRSRAYNEAIEALIPAFKTDDGSTPDAILSLEELVAAAKKLVIPQKVTHKEECPGCGMEVAFVVDRLPDQKMIAFLIERLAGAAQKTTQVNVHSEELVALVADTRILHELEFVGLTSEERAERARKLMQAGEMRQAPPVDSEFADDPR